MIAGSENGQVRQGPEAWRTEDRVRHSERMEDGVAWRYLLAAWTIREAACMQAAYAGRSRRTLRAVPAVIRSAPFLGALSTCVLASQGTAYPPAWRNNLRREVRERVRAQFGGKRPLLLKVGAWTARVAHGQQCPIQYARSMRWQELPLNATGSALAGCHCRCRVCC